MRPSRSPLIGVVLPWLRLLLLQLRLVHVPLLHLTLLRLACFAFPVAYGGADRRGADHRGQMSGASATPYFNCRSIPLQSSRHR
jgi:hypothetical protein